MPYYAFIVHCSSLTLPPCQSCLLIAKSITTVKRTESTSASIANHSFVFTSPLLGAHLSSSKCAKGKKVIRKKSEMEVIGKVYMRVSDVTDHLESHKYDADYFEAILQCLVGASGCERNWGDYKWIRNKKRNHTTEKLVFVHTQLVLQQKLIAQWICEIKQWSNRAIETSRTITAKDFENYTRKLKNICEDYE
jgi:hypothetical protein